LIINGRQLVHHFALDLARQLVNRLALLLCWPLDDGTAESKRHPFR